MKLIDAKDPSFEKILGRIAGRGAEDASRVEKAVRDIIAEVKKRGDIALASYTKKFDHVNVKGRLRVTEKEIDSALRAIPKKDLELLKLGAKRIAAFHKIGLPKSWTIKDSSGVTLGQKVTPIEKVGIYAPGGKAAYPSTVLMAAIPAKVAGVKEIIVTTPPRGTHPEDGSGGINPYVLAASRIAGVHAVYRVGGAQAIAALAYGTKTIPKVDKIVGPGNIFVATAKRLVFGTVAIDMVAGPSEILIVNDGSGDQAWLASDMLSQAEHDELASSILITTSHRTARTVKKEILLQLRSLERRRIIEASLEKYGLIIIAKDLEDALRISNTLAPEHLELCVRRPKELLGKIKNAGAIFLGHTTPEACGDYLAGPNHTLPTGGTARFSSPLNSTDFVKLSSVMEFSEKALKKLGPSIERFAELEGLIAHAKSVGIRLKEL